MTMCDFCIKSVNSKCTVKIGALRETYCQQAVGRMIQALLENGGTKNV